MKLSQSTNLLKTTSRDPGYKKIYIDDADKIKPGLQRGLFARKEISKGETIFIARGKHIRLNIKSDKDSALYPNAIGLSTGLWLDPEKNNPLNFLNHSCNPNVGIRGSVTVVAMKNIKPGEHLVMDYSTTEDDLLWKLETKCVCGAPNCRKVIRSIQHLPVTIYKSYLPYIPRALQAEYTRYNGISKK